MTGAHPEASHAVQLLQAATLHHTTQLQAAMDTLRAGVAGLSADRDAVLAGESELRTRFEGSADALKARVASFVSELLAAEAAWISEGRTVLAARTQALHDQAHKLHDAVAQMNTALAACDSLLSHPASSTNPLSLSAMADSANTAAGLTSLRGPPCVSRTLEFMHNFVPLESALGDNLCELRTAVLDAQQCIMEGPALAGFLLGSSHDKDVLAQNCIDVVLKDEDGALVTAADTHNISVSVVWGSDAPQLPSTAVRRQKHLISEGRIRVSFSTRADVDELVIVVALADGSHVRGSPLMIPNITVDTTVFTDSTILAQVPRPAYKSFLSSLRAWLPRVPMFQLLYRSSRDGPTPAAFHRLCDGKGATLTLFRSSSGHTFGGYTEVSWRSGTGTWASATDAFLFNIVNANGDAPARFPLSSVPHPKATWHHHRFGPTFGDGDLQVCGNMASPTSAFGSAAGLTYIVFPKAYKDEGPHRRGNSTFTDVTDGNDFVPQEIEVWAVV